MDRKQILSMLFAMYGKERDGERLEAYLFALSPLTDHAVTYAVKRAMNGEIGDSAFLPTAPQLALAARSAPEAPVQYQKLNDLPPVYEILPGNLKRVTREAIVYFGLEKVQEWIGKTISAELLANESNDNLLICPPKSEASRLAIRALIQRLELQKPQAPLRLVDQQNGIVEE